MARKLYSSGGMYIRVPDWPAYDEGINAQDAAEAVIDKLGSELDAKLAALDTEYNDGITCGTVDKYWRSPQQRYPDSLNVVVVAETSEPINSGDQIQQHNLVAEVIIAGRQSTTSGFAATEVLTMRLWRICRGIQEVINKTDLDGAVAACFVKDIQASQIDVVGSGFEQQAMLEIATFV